MEIGVTPVFVPIPLADSIAAALSDRTTALAAAFIIGTHHADVLQWVTRTIFGGDASAADLEPRLRPKRRSNGNGRLRRVRRSSGHDKRDRDDEALVAAMRIDPSGTIGAWATEVGKSKTSVVTALARLRDAGLVVNAGRKWALAAPRELTPKWVEPLKAKDRAAHAHLNAAS